MVCLDLAKPESLTSIRLICMGLGVLQDTKTLVECKVPIFPGHPTPVNVSILPPKSETQVVILSELSTEMVPYSDLRNGAGRDHD
ncbi:hypothetical protein DYB28_000824 [Aphanomyces astaci]|uniref:Uncharacterized protein n=1 Tax=Aphanomyces astaci TaxID=112090 RepID=A0A397B3S7_APHAT|nr:hypothetical protein DYB25_005908 [Aphanomyces astaci]RHZ24581.1 hypothetical protein DYB26_014039 [Aphanomyces astaci]RHZ38206.1 hypothetical protein DYB31_005513 [Aphanomyces astaci]RLO05818.1 hypothetical protein DYB28_000824 [Aphanomyces astaci]